MRDLHFIGKVENGRLPHSVSQSIAKAIRQLDGKWCEVGVKEKKNKRSPSQNRFWFGVVIPIIVQMFEDAGSPIDAEEAHSFAKENIWRWTKVVITPDGKKSIVARSSKELTKAEWEDKIEMTRVWAAEMGVLMPFPNETNRPPLEAYT